MANTYKHKQSSVAGKTPVTGQMTLGEIAVNTTDGKLFTKKSVSGTETVESFSPDSVTAANLASGLAGKAPLTGTGASGTWPIAISGNAATATNVAYSGLTGAVPTWNQNTTGNAATATKFATARTINGVSFDGTANITVADSTKAPLTGTGTSGTWPIAISGQAGVLGSFSTNTLDTVAPSLAMPQGVSSYLVNGVGAYPAGSYSGVLNLRCWTVGYGSLQFNYGYNAGNNGVWYRQAGDGTDTWSAWRKLVDSNNVGSYAPTKTGTGASGTWGISVTGNAATATNVAWTGVTGKPAVIAAGVDAAAARLAIAAAVAMPIVVVSVDTAAVANTHCVIAASGITLTAPTSWIEGDTFAVSEAITGSTYSIDFGATKVRGVAVGLVTIDAALSGFSMQYKNATLGLI